MSQTDFAKFAPYPPQMPEDKCPGHEYEYIGQNIYEIPDDERRGWESHYRVKRGRCIHCGTQNTFIGNWVEYSNEAGRRMIKSVEGC